MFLSAAVLFFGAAFCILRVTVNGGSFPLPLSHAEEQQLLARVQQGDLYARNKLVEHNLRLVAHIVKKYYTANEDTDDLISIGTIGLIKGVSTYDPTKNVRLATYASRCIENEILMYFRSCRKKSREISLEDPLEQSSETGSLTLLDVLSCEDDSLDRVECSDRYQLLYHCFHTCLNSRERSVLSLRYGLSGEPPMSQRDVASLHGISRSYVSRIEKRAIEKLAVIMNRP